MFEHCRCFDAAAILLECDGVWRGGLDTVMLFLKVLYLRLLRSLGRAAYARRSTVCVFTSSRDR